MATSTFSDSSTYEAVRNSPDESRKAPSSLSAPQVKLQSYTSSGAVTTQTVIGIVSSEDPKIEQFRGLPYGTVPGRWQHSTLRTSLPNDLFDASKHGPKCPQPSEPNNTGIYQAHREFPVTGESEYDCLNLFITRPSQDALAEIGIHPSKCQLPVHVYIHGGAFAFGAGTDPPWDPVRLVSRSLDLRKPFIAVHINYRLNILGFAASSCLLNSQKQTSAAKGCNFGLCDQRIALKWVKKNIAYFGGDPRNLVLGGQSAGGCSVHAHVLDAKHNNTSLFNRAIIQSGAFTTVGIGPIPIEENDWKWNALCDALNIGDLPESQQLEALRATSPQTLLGAVEKLGWPIFRPACDGLTISASPSSPTTWDVNLDTSSKQEDLVRLEHTSEPIRIFIGSTQSEGSPFIAGALASGRLNSFEDVLGVFEEAFDHRSDDVLAVLGTYGIKRESTVPSLHLGLIEFMTHSAFTYSIISAFSELTTDIHDASRPTTAQLYHVRFGNPFPGFFHDAHHCVDLIYQFDAFHEALDEQDRKEMASGYQGISNRKLSEQMQKDWIDFIAGDDKLNIAEGSVLVYDEDRQVRMEKMKETAYWVDVNRKLDMIGRFRLETASAMRRLMVLER